MDHFVVCAADNAFLGDLLVNRGVEKMVEASGLSVDSRDISERECRHLPTGLS